MQSGKGNLQRWILEFISKDTGISVLMDWESSIDTLSEVNLTFSTKEQAIEYAKKKNIDYYVIEPQKRKIVKKSYAENFIKEVDKK